MASFDYSLSWLTYTWDVIGRPRWTVITVALLYALYKILTRKFAVFKSIGVRGPSPWPVLGSMLPFMKLGTLEHDLQMKRTYGSIVGTFLGSAPTMLIYDLDLLKAILVKEFTNFQNRTSILPLDFPLDTMLLLLKDDHWKHVRNTLTPTFSSGKLRKMEPLLERCANTLLDNLKQEADKNETFNLRDYSGAYTMDVIASTAFGLQIDSHNDPNNQFVRMSNIAMDCMRLKTFLGILFFFFPFLSKPLGLLGFKLIPKEVNEFFVETVNRALEERREDCTGKAGAAVDFVQLMVNAEEIEHNHKDEDTASSVNVMNEGLSDDWKQNRRGLTHDEVLAQSVIFLLAGYDTTANTLSFLGYLLAVNGDCQDKLIAEIDSIMDGQDHVTLDLVNKMPYLDMCVSETLRLYPPLPRVDRVASEQTTINGLVIPKGLVINVPVYALHYDPEYWSEPTKFNPDRFLPEAKASRNPYCYLPFSMGPRHCIGMRLALLEMKLAMVHILLKFKLVVCEETQIPLIVDKHQVRDTQGVKLRVESRNN